MSTERKDPRLALDLVTLENILLCGAKGCPSALSLVEHPAPGVYGWTLVRGWWLCPADTEAMTGATRRVVVP